MVTCNAATHKVHVGGVLLYPTPSQRLYNHSPDGFSWGYSGSGPAQLALALLQYFTGDDHFAMMKYQDFKSEVVASMNQNGTEHIPNRIIKAWIIKHGGKVKEELK